MQKTNGKRDFITSPAYGLLGVGLVVAAKPGFCAPRLIRIEH